jgi:pyruvate dehydrogenase E1 component alpha subunit
MASGMGIKSFCIDGNNVEKIIELTSKELLKVRSGLGPRFIEYSTYRWREHCGPNFDNDIGYRTEKEFQKWKKNDPIELFEHKLLKNKEITKKEIKKIEDELLKKTNLAFNYAKKSPFPNQSEAFKNLYAD